MRLIPDIASQAVSGSSRFLQTLCSVQVTTYRTAFMHVQGQDERSCHRRDGNQYN